MLCSDQNASQWSKVTLSLCIPPYTLKTNPANFYKFLTLCSSQIGLSLISTSLAMVVTDSLHAFLPSKPTLRLSAFLLTRFVVVTTDSPRLLNALRWSKRTLRASAASYMLCSGQNILICSAVVKTCSPCLPNILQWSKLTPKYNPPACFAVVKMNSLNLCRPHTLCGC